MCDLSANEYTLSYSAPVFLVLIYSAFQHNAETVKDSYTGDMYTYTFPVMERHLRSCMSTRGLKDRIDTDDSPLPFP